MKKLIAFGLFLGIFIGIFIFRVQEANEKLPCSSEVNPHCQIYYAK